MNKKNENEGISQTAVQLLRVMMIAETGVTMHECNEVEMSALRQLLGVETNADVFRARDELTNAGFIKLQPMTTTSA